MNEKYKEKQKQKYNYLIKYTILCPFCKSITNIYLIDKHLLTKRCVKFQYDYSLLNDEVLLKKKLVDIHYNINIIKMNFINDDNEEVNFLYNNNL